MINISFDYTDRDLGSYYYTTILITVNPSNINREHDDYNTDFYTLLMHVVNHEFLHFLLHFEHDIDTSDKLDNITHNNQCNDNIWGYWLS